MDGKRVPESLIKGDRFAFIRGIPNLQRYFWEFKQHGQSAATISTLMPHLASVADDITFVKSMYATQCNHGPAQIFMNTGFQVIGRPSFGAWVSYGIGSDSKDLPAFVVLLSGESQPDGGSACWGSGFLPTQHQGVQLRKQGDPVLFLSNPDGMATNTHRRNLDLIRDLNQTRLDVVDDPGIATRIAAYGMSFKMQTSVPELQDLSTESASIHELYGTMPGQASFANNPGVTLGVTDEFGYTVAQDPVSVHDLHATTLHVLGVDHTKLTYKFQGRDFRLTDVEGRVVQQLLA